MADHLASRASVIALAMIAVLIVAGCAGSTASPVAPSLEKPTVEVSPRSAVVSDAAGPEKVAEALILALREDRPGDANALWGGPVKMFTGGLEYLEGSSHLVLSKAKDMKELPVTPLGTAPNARTPVQDTMEFRQRYASFASVDATLTPRPDDQTPNPPDAFVFRIGLGRLPEGRWDVLTISEAAIHLR